MMIWGGFTIMIGVETQFSRDFFSIGFAHFASLAYFLTSIFLDAIHEKIVVNNQDFFSVYIQKFHATVDRYFQM